MRYALLLFLVIFSPARADDLTLVLPGCVLYISESPLETIPPVSIREDAGQGNALAQSIEAGSRMFRHVRDTQVQLTWYGFRLVTDSSLVCADQFNRILALTPDTIKVPVSEVILAWGKTCNRYGACDYVSSSEGGCWDKADLLIVRPKESRIMGCIAIPTRKDVVLWHAPSL